jgi:hypothetical protein
MRLAIVSGPMCAAVIVVMVAVPSHASKSCMTQAEARAVFATSHLYWHGSGHCWDATAPRQALVHRIKPIVTREAQADDEEPKKPDSKWRNAMSEMLTDDSSTIAPALRMLPDATPAWAYDNSEAPRSSAASWLERWVDIAQVAPAEILGRSGESSQAIQKVEPMVTPTRVILILLGLVLTIVVIELLFRSTIRER